MVKGGKYQYSKSGWVHLQIKTRVLRSAIGPAGSVGKRGLARSTGWGRDGAAAPAVVEELAHAKGEETGLPEAFGECSPPVLRPVMGVNRRQGSRVRIRLYREMHEILAACNWR